MKQQDDLEKYQDIDATNNDIKPIISFTKEDIEDGKNPKNHHVITTITSSDGKKSILPMMLIKPWKQYYQMIMNRQLTLMIYLQLNGRNYY